MSHLKDRYLSTYTGKKFFPYDPRPEQICIEDIAHGLSMLCRFVGQCRFFFSVAEHSIAVARLLPANLKLFGLLHDASEAYLADLPRPVKAGLPEYKAIEANVERVIAEKFELPFPMPPAPGLPNASWNRSRVWGRMICCCAWYRAALPPCWRSLHPA